MMSTATQKSVKRIIALPLTQTASSNRPYGLTYYHFQIHDKSTNTPQTRWSRTLSWAQKKATDTWSGFGKAPEGSWKIKVFRTGEKLVDRIDFEELSLKAVDPSLGPKIMRWRGKEKDTEKPQIPLLYPPSVQSHDIALANLRYLVNQRTPRHRKGFWTWLIISPFTAPFMLIPIIPNLPFFFCVWRSWSHYRAYRASEYLALLTENGAIVPQASIELDNFYKASESEKTESASESEDAPLNASSSPDLLLPKDVVPSLISALGLKSSAEADLCRALEQAKARMTGG